MCIDAVEVPEEAAPLEHSLTPPPPATTTTATAASASAIIPSIVTTSDRTEQISCAAGEAPHVVPSAITGQISSVPFAEVSVMHRGGNAIAEDISQSIPGISSTQSDRATVASPKCSDALPTQPCKEVAVSAPKPPIIRRARNNATLKDLDWATANAGK
jgi:hypothetical protein